MMKEESLRERKERCQLAFGVRSGDQREWKSFADTCRFIDIASDCRL